MQAAETVSTVVRLAAPATAVIVTPVVAPGTTVVAVNVAVLWLSGTTTDVGTFTREVALSERATVIVPEVTLELSVTVQVLDWPPETVEGEQETPVSVGACGCTIVTAAPVFVLEIRPPVAELAMPLVNCTLEDVFNVEAETVSVTVATKPPEIGV